MLQLPRFFQTKANTVDISVNKAAVPSLVPARPLLGTVGLPTTVRLATDRSLGCERPLTLGSSMPGRATGQLGEHDFQLHVLPAANQRSGGGQDNLDPRHILPTDLPAGRYRLIVE